MKAINVNFIEKYGFERPPDRDGYYISRLNLMKMIEDFAKNQIFPPIKIVWDEKINSTKEEGDG
jgi:hypothetical protein